jgi:hypothetical protein
MKAFLVEPRDRAARAERKGETAGGGCVDVVLAVGAGVMFLSKVTHHIF